MRSLVGKIHQAEFSNTFLVFFGFIYVNGYLEFVMDFTILFRHGRKLQIYYFQYSFRKTPCLAGMVEHFLSMT